jgi:hypothetical protein
MVDVVEARAAKQGEHAQQLIDRNLRLSVLGAVRGGGKQCLRWIRDCFCGHLLKYLLKGAKWLGDIATPECRNAQVP